MFKITALRIFSTTLLMVLYHSSLVLALSITDDAEQTLEFPSPPTKVVSILPAATEIINALGQSLVGVTYHDTHLPGTASPQIVGGAFTPRFSIINGLAPDLLIVAPRDFEKAKKGRGALPYPILVIDDGVSLAESENRIRLLGKVFRKSERADEIIESNKELIKTVRLKTEKIPRKDRKKVMRLISGSNGLTAPGEDYFQTEIISAAGGLPPKLGRGSFVPVSLQAFSEFDPDIIFACGENIKGVENFLSQEGWNEISAVKNGRIYSFPCALTCRATTNTGYFTAWLASTIYTEEFSDLSRLVHPQKIISEKTIDLDFNYIEKARVVDSRLVDFVHRTLLIDFKSPQTIASSVGGGKTGIKTIGNSYSPTPTWSIYHRLGFERSRKDIFQVLGLNEDTAELMFTGADLNNLAIKSASFKDMKVTALVTAGVEGNALRVSKDTGAWYEPGTINIIVMSNHHLSEQAATRALITITEAKTAALWDMDIRSVQTPLFNPATGTGTDSIIVVAGEGPGLNGSSGHSKMGQLIGETVYEAVKEALKKQNGKKHSRNIFERLEERGLSISSLTAASDSPGQEPSGDFQPELEEVLLSPKYQGFLEAAFSLSDSELMGQLNDLEAFNDWALQIACEIAGRPVEKIEAIISQPPQTPAVLKTALNAIGTGIMRKKPAVKIRTRP